MKFAVYNKWLSTFSPSYFDFIDTLVQKDFKVNVNSLSKLEQNQALMVYYDFYKDGGAYDTLQGMFDDFASDISLILELKELMPILKNRSKSCQFFYNSNSEEMSDLSGATVPSNLFQVAELTDNSGIDDFPLKLHGIYTRAQIQAAIKTSTLAKKSSCREGVERNKTQKTESMLVDRYKHRSSDSTTDYKDYAISPVEFHWETQNSVSKNTMTGRNYINGTQTMLLFVRPEAQTSSRRTMGYIYLGAVTLKPNSIAGQKPMEIIWDLPISMPQSVFQWAKQL